MVADPGGPRERRPDPVNDHPRDRLAHIRPQVVWATVGIEPAADLVDDAVRFLGFAKLVSDYRFGQVLTRRFFLGRQTVAENAPDGLNCFHRQLVGRGFVAGHHLISWT